jgi:hypothetical protein
MRLVLIRIAIFRNADDRVAVAIRRSVTKGVANDKVSRPSLSGRDYDALFVASAAPGPRPYLQFDSCRFARKRAERHEGVRRRMEASEGRRNNEWRDVAAIPGAMPRAAE